MVTAVAIELETLARDYILNCKEKVNMNVFYPARRNYVCHRNRIVLQMQTMKMKHLAIPFPEWNFTPYLVIAISAGPAVLRGWLVCK